MSELNKDSELFVLDSAILSRGRGIICASVDDDKALKYSPYWWDCIPMDHTLDQSVYCVNSSKNLPDNLYNGSIEPIYSEKMVQILLRHGVKAEVFPIILLSKDKKVISEKYYLFHLLEQKMYDSLPVREYNENRVRVILSKSWTYPIPPMFRNEKYSPMVVITRDLKNELENNKITGCQYIPIDEYTIKYSIKGEDLGIPVVRKLP